MNKWIRLLIALIVFVPTVVTYTLAEELVVKIRDSRILFPIIGDARWDLLKTESADFPL
jgi:hypothetical protein